MQNYQFSLDSDNLKFKKLLEQISEENPCGQDIRRHEIFLRLKDIRNKVLNNNDLDDIWIKKNKHSESWLDVIALCETILTDYSKDLLVICHYIEAKSNIEGFFGVAESLRLFKRVCDEFGDSVYPKWDADKLEQGLVPFKWIETHLLELIKNISFDTNKIKPSLNSAFRYSWGEYLQAVKANHIEQKSAFVELIQRLDSSYVDHLSQALQFIVSVLISIDEVYIAKFLDNGVNIGFVEIIDLCNDLLLFLQEKCDNKVKKIEQEDEYLNEVQNIIHEKSDFIQNPLNSSINFSGNFSSVEEAYRLIAQANSYLLKHDFHSPSPYLIRRGLEWRKKSLYEVFVDLFSTTSNPQEIFTLLGLTHFDEKELD